MTPQAKWSLTLLVAGGLAGAVLVLRRDNTKLTAEVAERRQREHRGDSQPRPAEPGDPGHGSGGATVRPAEEAAQLRQQEVAGFQAQVRDLEAKARAEVGAKAVAAAALAANRDPERGLAGLENFRNVGRGSPATAVQTLVWAALQGDEPTLVAALALAEDAAEKARQLWARLPEAARAKYPAPENLAALMVTSEILRAEGAQIVATTEVDARHAVVSLRLAGVEGVERVPTELGADGWRITVPKKIMLALEKRLNPGAVGGAKK